MGIIRRQAFSNSAISYVGFALGYLNIIILFPRILGSELFGLTQLVVSTAAIITQMGNLSVPAVLVRYFPFYADHSESRKQFLSITTAMLLASMLTSLFITLVFEDQIIAYYAENSPLFTEYFLLLFPFVGFSMISLFLDSLNIANYRTAHSAFFREVVLRLLNLTAVILYSQEFLDTKDFMLLFTANQGLYCLFLASFLIQKGELRFTLDNSILDIKRFKEFVKYGFVTTLSGIANIATSIDQIMIGSMIGLSATGIYGVASAIGQVITIPSRSINRISQVVVSNAWKNNDLAKISRIYSKSVTINIVAGTWILIGVWSNERSLFELLPEGYDAGRSALLILLLGRLAGVGSGANGIIIAQSKLYSMNAVFNALSVGIIIITNIIFIPKLGITGAAIATLISVCASNFARYLLLKIKFGLEPFSLNQLFIFVVGVLSYMLCSVIPYFDNLILDFLVRSILVSGLFLLPTYWFALSRDFTETVDVAIKKAKNFIRSNRNR